MIVSLRSLVWALFARQCLGNDDFNSERSMAIYTNTENLQRFLYSLPDVLLNDIAVQKSQLSALQDLFDATSAGESSSFHNWFRPTNDPLYTHYCHFNGVACDNELYVISLDLNEMGLSGTVPESIRNFERLRRLNLRRNSFIGEIPRAIGHLTQLSSLILGENKFVGTIPPTLGYSYSMRHLLLQSNDLTGTIPSSLCQLPHLRTLDVSSNGGIVGKLSTCLGDLAHLTNLRIQNSGLTGRVPAVLCELSGYGCDGVACGAGSYQHPNGRQSSNSTPCIACPDSSNVIGRTSCSISPPMYPSSSPSSAPSAAPTTISPSSSPTMMHSYVPTIMPSSLPTQDPTATPTTNPTEASRPHSDIPSAASSSEPTIGTPFPSSEIVIGHSTARDWAWGVLAAIMFGAVCCLVVGVYIFSRHRRRESKLGSFVECLTDLDESPSTSSPEPIDPFSFPERDVEVSPSISNDCHGNKVVPKQNSTLPKADAARPPHLTCIECHDTRAVTSCIISVPLSARNVPERESPPAYSDPVNFLFLRKFNMEIGKEFKMRVTSEGVEFESANAPSITSQNKPSTGLQEVPRASTEELDKALPITRMCSRPSQSVVSEQHDEFFVAGLDESSSTETMGPLQPSHGSSETTTVTSNMQGIGFRCKLLPVHSFYSYGE